MVCLGCLVFGLNSRRIALALGQPEQVNLEIGPWTWAKNEDPEQVCETWPVSAQLTTETGQAKPIRPVVMVCWLPSKSQQAAQQPRMMEHYRITTTPMARPTGRMGRSSESSICMFLRG